MMKDLLKKRSFWGMWSFVFAASLSCTEAKTDNSPLEKAPFVNMQRLDGKWYVSSRIPTWFDKKVQNVSVDFKIKDVTSFGLKWNYSPSEVKTEGSTQPKSEADLASESKADIGALATLPKTESWDLSGKAGKGGESGNWRIYPFGPFYINLQVIEFSADYSWIMVGSADRSFAWVLTRSEIVEPELMGGIKARLEEFKFDVAALKFSEPSSSF